jgi:hypothetical protein
MFRRRRKIFKAPTNPLSSWADIALNAAAILARQPSGLEPKYSHCWGIGVAEAPLWKELLPLIAADVPRGFRRLSQSGS